MLQPFPRCWVSQGLSQGHSGKDSTCNAGDAGDAGDVGLIPGSKDALEEGMATHSGILAWEIPWTEHPDELQSMGSERVGHD